MNHNTKLRSLKQISVLICAGSALFSISSAFSKANTDICAQFDPAVSNINANTDYIWAHRARPGEQAEWTRAQSYFSSMKRDTVRPDVPSVQVVHLPTEAPDTVATPAAPSAGISDLLLEESRVLSAFDDDKLISDYKFKSASASDIEGWRQAACQKVADSKATVYEAQRVAFLDSYVLNAYETSYESDLTPTKRQELVKPLWSLKDDGTVAGNKRQAAFTYTENQWQYMVKDLHPVAGSSLLATPYPAAVPAGRFQEQYYWDTYFGIQGLLSTDRLPIAQMQLENFLEDVRLYGFVPNGSRDYYLSRSQPPFLSSVAHEVYDASVKAAGTDKAAIAHVNDWLAKRAFPLIEHEYNTFWMGGSRYDVTAGLNHYSDAINLPRPERSGRDHDDLLGDTYTDVRARAESGLDFTESLPHNASKVYDVLLNTLLYKAELDLAYFAGKLGQADKAAVYTAAAAKRKDAINKYMWNADKKEFNSWDSKNQAQIPILHTSAFVTLYVGLASPVQAEGMIAKLTKLDGKDFGLLRQYGMMSSEDMTSSGQWDGTSGWAPLQIMTMEGLQKYGRSDLAAKIATGWTDGIANIYDEHQYILERLDVVTGKAPDVDPGKYDPQKGFLWTNASYVWALKNVLGKEFVPLTVKK